MRGWRSMSNAPAEFISALACMGRSFQPEIDQVARSRARANSRQPVRRPDFTLIPVCSCRHPDRVPRGAIRSAGIERVDEMHRDKGGTGSSRETRIGFRQGITRCLLGPYP
jgi:hypothetical protein